MSCSRIEQLSTYEYNKNHIEYKIPNSKKKKASKDTDLRKEVVTNQICPKLV